jgi:hypothetical protein
VSACICLCSFKASKLNHLPGFLGARGHNFKSRNRLATKKYLAVDLRMQAVSSNHHASAPHKL